jgi:hypothetical protein
LCQGAIQCSTLGATTNFIALYLSTSTLINRAIIFPSPLPSALA